MAVDINTLNIQLLTAFKNSNFIIVDDKAKRALAAANLQDQSAIDSAQTLGGVTGISNTSVGPSIVQLGDIVEVTTVNDSDDSDINLITGTRTSNGRLVTAIGSGAPTAVGKAVKEVTNKEPSEVKNKLKEISTPEGVSEIDNIDNLCDKGVDETVGLTNSVNTFNKTFAALIGIVGTSLIAKNLLQNQRGIFDTIQKVAPNIEPVQQEEVLKDLITGRKRKAIERLEEIGGTPAEEIEKELEQRDISQDTITDTTVAPEVGEKTTQDKVIGSEAVEWEGKDTPDTFFTFIGSKEELVAEFRESTRPITEIVAHWTGSYTNQNWGSEIIHDIHNQRGFSGIGYHYIIHRDGRLQRGRPINLQGAHAKAYGHNRYSIGVSMVGGYNCSSGTPNPDRFISADSLTPASLATFEMVMAAFYEVWPSGQAWGHNDITDLGKVDPGFDVQEYVFNKFGKVNVYPDKGQDPISSMTPAELAKARSQ